MTYEDQTSLKNWKRNVFNKGENPGKTTMPKWGNDISAPWVLPYPNYVRSIRRKGVTGHLLEPGTKSLDSSFLEKEKKKTHTFCLCWNNFLKIVEKKIEKWFRLSISHHQAPGSGQGRLRQRHPSVTDASRRCKMLPSWRGEAPKITLTRKMKWHGLQPG